jgi:hypothetical protein
MWALFYPAQSKAKLEWSTQPSMASPVHVRRAIEGASILFLFVAADRMVVARLRLGGEG